VNAKRLEWNVDKIRLLIKSIDTAQNYEELFKDLNLGQSYKNLSQLLLHSPDFPAPKVSTHCFYGVGMHTPKQFEYDYNFNGINPHTGHPPASVVPGLGDTVVNIESSQMRDSLSKNKALRKEPSQKVPTLW